MRPLVTTVAALRELSTGLSPDAIPTSSELFQYSGSTVDVLLTVADKSDAQRIMLIRELNREERFVPEHLAHLRREVLSRLASFVERARTDGPLTLPRGWHQYKHNNLIAFFVVSKPDPLSTRWIAEVISGGRSDIILWATTTVGHLETLEDFEATKPSLPDEWVADWESAVRAAADRTAVAKKRQQPDVEILLSPIDKSTTKGWTYDQWMDAISADQRSFIEASTEKSIRLRGPAGSGKTLALTLKAIREVLHAKEAETDVRVLIVTHSWSLATEISDSIDSMGGSFLREIDVFPLLEIAKNISPQYANDSFGFTLAGDDSFSGKQAQLDEIVEVLEEFISGDWITYRSLVSDGLRIRFDSHDPDERFALAWDLLIEFGSVIGAAAIFPGAGAESRYFQLARASWMLPLHGRDDMRVIFALYKRFMESLDDRAMLTSDQVLADLLSHLETNAWNKARRRLGYDLIFIDEFHLFSPLERQIIHCLARDVAIYPRVFMAVDPRQSPSEAFIGVASGETRSSWNTLVEGIGDVANFELTTVHRFTPQILNLIKHVHHEFPTLDLGKDWSIDFDAVESAQEEGPLPLLNIAASRSGEEDDIAKAVLKLYPTGRLALAVVDDRKWPRFSDLASRIDTSKKFQVSTISSRTDIERLGYRRHGLVVAPAEYLAGLQFDTVLVAGIPDMQAMWTPTNERSRLLSLLYLALSRAQREVRVFVNEDDGGAPEVLARAVANRLMLKERGSLV